ncbi:MAG: amidophosphoribosyltransferase [Rikenellaceae bacterium]|nr:amidophosphoribosyltransferase [Rikenellaceae bacterium]
MSDAIKHECGIVQIRLLKPLSSYASDHYGLNKLYLMMEKQHNRGQEGAGVVCVKVKADPGREYIARERALGSGAISAIFDVIRESETNPMRPYIGELYMGHLRYATGNQRGMAYVHPFLRRSNWRCRTLCIAGNFGYTNVDNVFEELVQQGQHPRNSADSHVLLEQLGYMLDQQCEQLYNKYSAQGYRSHELNAKVENEIDFEPILRAASSTWDGGYVMTGVTGSGDSFTMRDPWGIRSAHYYMDENVVVIASERAVIQTAMNVPYESVRELQPGQALFIKQNGEVQLRQIQEPINPRPCSFERIYFSRGSDADIYRERKLLGKLLVDKILQEVDYDIDHTVFSFIPNTAEVSYFGMLEGLDEYLNDIKLAKILALNDKTDQVAIRNILESKVRSEKIAIKDIKLRTFIAQGGTRDDMAAHVYDVTYGCITPNVDNVVVIDDSIVRGTTLRQSILQMIGRLKPLKIVVVSSAPQVRYPDYYGIDMSRMEEFIAFNAAIELLRESGQADLIDTVYKECKESLVSGECYKQNFVKKIYSRFSDDQITRKIAAMVTPDDIDCSVSIVYQSLEGLAEACAGNDGDWYFSGDYPTPWGNRLVNEAYIKYYEKFVLGTK